MSFLAPDGQYQALLRQRHKSVTSCVVKPLAVVSVLTTGIYRPRVVSLSKTLYSPKVLVNYPGSGGSVPI